MVTVYRAESVPSMVSPVTFTLESGPKASSTPAAAVVLGVVLALIAPDDGIGLALILVLGAIDHVISVGGTICLLFVVAPDELGVASASVVLVKFRLLPFTTISRRITT